MPKRKLTLYNHDGMPKLPIHNIDDITTDILLQREDNCAHHNIG